MKHASKVAALSLTVSLILGVNDASTILMAPPSKVLAQSLESFGNFEVSGDGLEDFLKPNFDSRG